LGDILLNGQLQRHDPLNATAESAYAYLAANEALLKRFLGPDRVTVIADGCYRIQMKRFRILGFSFKPGFDVLFEQHPPDRITMRSLGCQLTEQSHGDLGFEAGFEGDARFRPDGDACVLGSVIDAQVRLTTPQALDWLPASLVQPIANGLLQATLEALSLRLIPMMRTDLARQRKSEPSPL
jgi:hypothetical protein